MSQIPFLLKVTAFALSLAAAAAAESSRLPLLDAATLETHLAELLDDLDRTDTYWVGDYRGARVFVFAHEGHDRMRMAAPVTRATGLKADKLRKLLEANYDRALDAKYALARDLVWAVFAHPLSSLTPAELEDGLEQIATLRDNYGSTYASTSLVFGDP